MPKYLNCEIIIDRYILNKAHNITEVIINQKPKPKFNYRIKQYYLSSRN